MSDPNYYSALRDKFKDKRRVAVESLLKPAFRFTSLGLPFMSGREFLRVRRCS
jgi:hypothetical protein